MKCPSTLTDRCATAGRHSLAYAARVRVPFTYFSAIAAYAALTMPLFAATEAEQPNITQATAIRQATENLVAQHLTLQLEKLAQNGLENCPEYQEIVQLRSRLLELTDGPMREVEQILGQALSANSPEETRRFFIQADQRSREIIVSLVQGRHAVARRLQRLRTAEDIRYLLSLQQNNLELAKAEPRDEHQLLSIQQAITQLVVELKQSLEIGSTWDDWQAERSREALALLVEMNAQDLSDAAIEGLRNKDWEAAQAAQAKVLTALQAVEQIVEGVDGSAVADRNAAIRLVDQLIERQSKLRLHARTLSETSPRSECVQISHRQNRIHDELTRLDPLAHKDASLIIPLTTARDSAFQASALLVQQKIKDAILHQAELAGLLQLLRERLTATSNAAKSVDREDVARAEFAVHIGTVARLTEACERLFAIERDLADWATHSPERIFDPEGTLQEAYAARQAKIATVVERVIKALKELETEPPVELSEVATPLLKNQKILETKLGKIEGELEVAATQVAESARRASWLLETAARKLRERHRQLSKQLSALAQKQLAPVAQQRTSQREELARLEVQQATNTSKAVELEKLERTVAQLIVRGREIERDEESADDMVLAAMDQAEGRRAMMQTARTLKEIPIEKVQIPIPKHQQLAKTLQNSLDQFSDAQIELGRKTWQINAQHVTLPPALVEILDDVSFLSSSPEQTQAAAAQLKASKMGDGLIPTTPRRTAEMIAGREAISRMALIFGDNPKAKTQMSVGASDKGSKAPQQKAAEKPTESGSKKETDGKGQGKSRGAGKGKAQGKGESDGQGQGKGRGAGVGQGNASGTTEKSESGKASAAAKQGGGAGGGNAEDNTDNENGRQSGASQNTAGSNAGTRQGDTQAQSKPSSGLTDSNWESQTSDAQSRFRAAGRSGRPDLPSGWRDRLREFFSK